MYINYGLSQMIMDIIRSQESVLMKLMKDKNH